MHQLEIHVDRILASLQASPQRKLEIRSELLQHLNEAYEEEFARTSDADRACTLALERLGDPAQLRRDLQAGIPFPYLMARSFRRTLLVFALQSIVFLPLLLILTLDPEMKVLDESIIANAWSLFRPFLSGQLVIAFNLFFVGLILDWIDVRSLFATHRIARTFLRTFIPFGILLASGSLYSLLAGASWYSVMFVVRWSVLSLTTALAIPLFSSVLKRESSDFHNWQRTQTMLSE
ncbi:MAG: hypothetical protein KDA68_16765 [Planctomycetaceae bacterium]|nr:hypothetical protein [Planctomycetaceae bacterium]